MNASYPTANSRGSTRKELRPIESGFGGAWGKGFFLFSIMVHLALGGALFSFQGISQNRVLPLVMQMDLASMDFAQDLAPSPGEGGAPAGKEANETSAPEVKESLKRETIVTVPSEPKEAKKPASNVVSVKEPVPVKERVAVKPERTAKPSPEPASKEEPVRSIEPSHKSALKKKTYQADKVLESARSSIEKKVEKQAESSEPSPGKALDKALARLEKAVESQAGSRSGASSDLSPVSGVSGNGVKGTKTDYTAIDLYNLELMYRIQQNWAFNQRLARSEKAIEARVLIKILKNGQIRDVWFETRSGNSYLDDSALKAVKKSNPLPPLPKGYATYDIGLRFTPSGLK